MNDQDIQSHRRGANRRRHAIHEDGVKGRVVSKQKHYRDEYRRNEEERIVRCERYQNGNDAEQATDRTNQKIAVLSLCNDAISDPAATECSRRAGEKNSYAQNISR